jgi:hypothetical protein
MALGENHSPPWRCPTFDKGVFVLVPKSLVSKETVQSKRLRNEGEWEPDWTTYSFTAWIKCSHAECGEEAVVSGDGGVNEHWDSEGESEQYSDYFTPRFCSRMPDIFSLPKDSPQTVTSELRAAFRLFWSDEAASANRVRVALERLLDHLKISTSVTNQKGKVVELTLHERIKEFETTEPVIAKQLMALKWLCNTGSHVGKVTQDDVLDGFEILEHALNELIGEHTKRIRGLAQKLEDKHKPKRK